MIKMTVVKMSVVKQITTCLALLGMFSVVAIAAELDLNNAKCVVADSRAAMDSKSSEFKEAKVFFCCGNCKAKFDAEPAKFTAKANHQLVVTKQAKQTACPFSGGPVNEEKTIEVKGAEVAFCCGNCQGKAQEMDVAQQVKTIFGEDGFAKGFKVTAAKAE